MKRPLFVFAVLAAVNTFAQDSLSLAEANSFHLKTLPVHWHQHSAEYRALCYQAFNVASLRIEKFKKRKRKKYAIITDIDETVLNNSYYEAANIIEGTSYHPDSWKRWTDKAIAPAVPGAVEFLKSASKKGIAIFYISNRDSNEIKSTIRNLKHLNFPNADSAHMLFRINTSSKEERRQMVTNEYQIVLMLGDNLNDFTPLFEKRNIDERNSEVEKIQDEWGRKFIILPNAIYGEWEDALYDYQRRINHKTRKIKLTEKLEVNP